MQNIPITPVPHPKPKPIVPTPLPKPIVPTPLPKPIVPTPLPKPIVPTPLPKPIAPTPLPKNTDKDKYEELKKKYNKMKEDNENLLEVNGRLLEHNKRLLEENIFLKRQFSTHPVTPPNNNDSSFFTPSPIHQQDKEKRKGENISKQLKDDFEGISVELFKKQDVIVQKNHNTVFDSSITTTINRKKLQTGIQGNEQMNGIVGKEYVTIFILTDNNDLFGIYHHNQIQLNNSDFNEDKQFVLFSLAKNGVYNPTIWEREGGIETVNIYDPDYGNDIFEVFDAFTIKGDSSIEISEDFKQSYKRSSGDDGKLISKEKSNMKKLLAIEWN
ncbi:hypothetical protein QTN25_005472 [Entamoeba marina]